MTEPCNIPTDDDMESDALFPTHQDSLQGPQKRIVTVFPHLAYSGSKWNCYISVGMATDEQKAPLVQEIAQAGSPLNGRYFLGAENLELWIDNELAGLCRCSLSTPDEDEAPTAFESFAAFIRLDAVFIRPCYQSLGFGEHLSEQCVELVTNSLLVHFRERYSSYSSIDVVLIADFESEQGERFFDQMTDNLEMNMDLIAEMLKVPIKVSTDAGY
jgi:GNAT superfamily N-acetyltransferase